jgi:hypothetical protein
MSYVNVVFGDYGRQRLIAFLYHPLRRHLDITLMTWTKAEVELRNLLAAVNEQYQNLRLDYKINQIPRYPSHE